jgi:alanyl-tRNA synthetase
MTSTELRQKYLDFFQSKGHAIIPSASLIPENDPSVLFTTAGMHPLVPYLLGEPHPAGRRLADVQKCVRLQDIDEVGDNRHQTFFEMLGNWSLGDYFKQESIEWSWEFLTSPKWLNLNPQKIAVSVFEGDKTAPRDDESAKIWQELGVPTDRIAYLPKKDNWWEPAGDTGPCGPDTEIFWWRGESALPSAKSNPATDPDNWLEIWNNVFMQYFKEKDGNYKELKQKNVDTGMGLERTLVALNGFVDVFQVDTFWPLIQKMQELSGREYVENLEVTRSMRIITDHIRTATIIMGDDLNITPANTDQGYIVRRLLRRAVRHGRMLGIKENFCSAVAEVVIGIFKDIYPEVKRNREFVLNEIAKEESKFRNTIEAGIKHFNTITTKHLDNGELTGKEAFDLYQSYGFPIEMTDELAKENGIKIDLVGFEAEMKKHQDLSRAGAEQKFKGGLANQDEMSVKYHTATHLLHAALRQVLGKHVEQKGSNITAERLRFDFSHPAKMTEEEKQQVEELVNYAISQNYPVVCEEQTVAEAKKKGAMGLFEEKYGNKVKVYTVGDPNQEVGAHLNTLAFSREICGGPHVNQTGILGHFKIVKEEASSAGIRRIKAILE